jgi:3-oxoacyl-[acyl-carrier-protein] synthase-3
MQASRAVITGVGGALPARRVSNDELPAHLDTNDTWIRERTGICFRHLADDTETTGSLAEQAARKALAQANLSADDIDLIIVSTSTPDLTMPSTACLVQGALGNTRAAAFDLNAACSGFVYGLNVANAMLQNGQASKALIIGAETMSRIVDWQDRSTCVLFGDGAGAVVLEARTDTQGGILACRMQSDGAQQGILRTNGAISRTQQAGHLHMEGKEVFRHAVDKMGGGLELLLEETGLTLDDVRWVIPHQANARIIQAIAKKTGLSQDRFIMTLDRHANTSAASIPLALSVAVEENRLSDGDILALPALGAGLTWGACIIKWVQHT